MCTMYGGYMFKYVVLCVCVAYNVWMEIVIDGGQVDTHFDICSIRLKWRKLPLYTHYPMSLGFLTFFLALAFEKAMSVVGHCPIEKIIYYFNIVSGSKELIVILLRTLSLVSLSFLPSVYHMNLPECKENTMTVFVR